MTTEIILGAVAEAVIGLVIADLSERNGLVKIRDKIKGPSQETIAFQRALAATYSAFSQRYPNLSGAFFDEIFLKKSEIVLELSKVITPNKQPNLAVIERTWKNQFRYEPNDGISLPIKFFVETLSDEVKTQPLLKPFFDSRALDQLHSISKNIDNQSEMQNSIVTLLTEIRDLIHKGDSALSKSIRSPLEDRLPPQEAIVTDFIGRNKETKALWNWFNNPNNRLWVLVGDGGKGKTSLAYRFAIDVKNKAPEPFQAVLWMTAKRKRFTQGRIVSTDPDFSDLDTALSQILISYGWVNEINQAIPDKEKVVIDLLTEFPAFIIVDDVDSLESENEDVISFFVLRVPYTKSKVLFTSRRVMFGMGANRTQISGFSLSDTEKFVLSRSKRMGLDKNVFNKNIIERIHKVADGSPLYIEDLLRLSAVVRSIDHAIKTWDEKGGSEARKYSLGREIDMLSKDARKVLFAACVGHFATSFAELETVTGLSENTVSSALQELQDIFLVPKPRLIEGEQRYEVNINTKTLVKEVFGSRSQYKTIESSYRAISDTFQITVKGDVSAILRQASLLIGQGHYEQTERLLLNAIIQYSGESSLHSTIGRVFFLMYPTRVTDARENFKRAEQLGYSRPDMYEYWASLEAAQGEWLQSAEIAERGLAVAGVDKVLLYLAGNARLMLARSSLKHFSDRQAREEARSAKTHLENAVKLRSKDPRERSAEPKAYQALVLTCELLNDNSTAKNYLDQWFHRYPNDPNVIAERTRLTNKRNLRN